MTETKPVLGFIGLGLMGQPMAARLLDHGYPLHIWNRSPEKAAGLVAKGAVADATAAAVAARADIILLCLTNAEAVEHVVLGSCGIAAAGRPRKTVVDLSTIPPRSTRAIAARLQDGCGMAWVDAPVSGGVPGAEQGRLAIMCGGYKQDVARVRPVLDCLARRVTHMGPLGAGQITKMCNQLIVSCNLLAVAEAVNLARAAGIEAERLADALAGGWADSQPLQLFGPRMAIGTEEPRLGAVATMLKDVHAVQALCEELRLTASLAQKAGEIYAAAAEAGLGERDLTALAAFLAPGEAG